MAADRSRLETQRVPQSLAGSKGYCVQTVIGIYELETE